MPESGDVDAFEVDALVSAVDSGTSQLGVGVSFVSQMLSPLG